MDNKNVLDNNCFEDENFTGVRGITDLNSKSFYNCNFKDCDFTECNFTSALFSECVFTNSNLSLVKLTETRFQEAVFDSCKILGTDFTTVNQLLFEVEFKNCQLNECIFAGLSMENTGLVNCKIHQCDFLEANLSKADFSGSDLEGSLFESCDLRGADFISAMNYSIHPFQNKISGAKFSLPEVLSLLKVFEIKINEK